ncbi:MAG: endonuclease/exonuclease/phosphatase family protein, partial [Aquihabitans sp.]
APLVADAIRGRFDVCAMSEVFDSVEQEAVAAGLPGYRTAAGPGQQGLRRTGSGLLTAVDESVADMTASVPYAYRTGGDLRDSDTYATKGALLVRVRVAPDLPEVDVVSTHLFAGGELLPIPGSDDRTRHHQARLRQLGELVAFIESHRSPTNPLVVLGDFNVSAHDPDPRLNDPTSRYRDLVDHLEPLGLRDVWADHGIGPGATCSFTDRSDLPSDPDDADQVVDDPEASPATSAGERIDYLWVASPTDGSTSVHVDRPRRWAFTGRGVQGGPAGSLSDHLALSTTLHLRRVD